MGDGLATIMRCLFRKLRTCGSSGNRSDSSSGTNSGSNSNNSSTTGINGRPDTGMDNSKNYHHNQSIISANALNSTKLMKSNQNYENAYNNQQQQQQQQHQIYNNYQYQQHYTSGVPISISIMILICYVTLGAALFHRLQTEWNVLESLYFCFTSLGTIGFGELEPKGNIAQYAASAYILIGMAIGAMCFNLIQSEITHWLRRFDRERVTDEKSMATPQTISGPGPNAGLGPSGFTHLMPHHMYNPGGGPMEDVALVTVAVTPKS